MNDRSPTLRLACIAPVFAYGVVMILAHPLHWTVLSAAAAAALALPLVAIVTPRFAGWLYAPAALVLGAMAVAWLAQPGAASGLAAGLAMGVLVGAPVGIFAVIVEYRASLSTVLLGMFGGLSLLTIDLATLRALPAASPAGASAWSTSAATVVGQQLASLSQWAAGAGVAAPPLAYVGDAAFEALVVLAASGVLLSWLAFDARLGVRSVDGLRAPPPPPGPAWTGVRSLVAAMGAVLVFELAAALSPVVALQGAVAAVAGISVAIAWIVRPTAPPRGPARERPTPVATAAGPD